MHGTSLLLVALRRARAGRGVLVATAATVLVASTLLAAGPVLTEAVATAGLRQTLRSAPPTAASVRVRTALDGADPAALDARVREAIAPLLAPAGGTTVRTARSRTFALQSDDLPDHLTAFAAVEGLRARTSLVAGSWPTATPAPAPVAAVLTAPAAERLGIVPGDRFQVRSQFADGLAVSVVVTGTVRIDDPTAPAWWDDPMVLTGSTSGGSVRTTGPLLVPRPVLLQRLAAGGVELAWIVRPDPAGLTTAGVAPLRRATAELVDTRGDGLAVDTGLPTLLDRAATSLLASRAGVLVATVQIGLLAVVALMLVATFVVGQRRLTTALLRARGASRVQVALLATVEAAAVTVPAVAAAPWLARAVVAALEHVGPLRTTGLELDPHVTGAAWVAAVLAGLAAVVGLTLPAARAGFDHQQVRQARARPDPRGWWQRTGLDLVLLLVTAVGLWQLRVHGSPVTASLRGRLGVDPLLVAAPALALLVGGLLVLRLLPLAARVGARVAPRLRGVTVPLGSWQLTRRPEALGRATLLPLLALAVGSFAVVASTTWTTSQRDQAAHQVGADVRVDSPPGAGGAGTLGMANRYRRIDGVTATSPSRHASLRLAADAGETDVLAVGRASADEVLRVREDLLSPGAAAWLTGGDDDAPPVAVPASATRVAVTAAARVELECADVPSTDELGCPPVDLDDRILQVTLVLRDGQGVHHPVRVDEGLVPDGRPHRVAVDLVADGEDRAGPVAPVSLVGVRLDLPVRDRRHQVITLTGSITLRGARTDRGPLPSPPGGWRFRGAEPVGPSGGMELTPTGDDATTFTSGTTFSDDEAGILAVPASTAPPPTLTGVATPELLSALGARTGDTLSFRLAGAPREVRIVGTAETYPTLPDDVGGRGLLVDLAALSDAAWATQARTLDVGHHLLAVRDGASPDVIATLRATSTTDVTSRAERLDELLDDPIGRAVLGALWLGFAGAALLAAVGFTVATTTTTRARRPDFAVLRAGGLHRRQLAGWLALEQGVLAVLAVTTGLGVGLGVARAVLPVVSLSDQAARVVPPLRVVIPWAGVASIGAGLLVLLLTIVAVVVRREPGRSPAAVLRRQEAG